MTKHIILTGGHHVNRQGATHNGNSEFPETRVWADTIFRYLHELGVSATVVGCAPLASKVIVINNTVKHAELECLAISVHFNSSAKGKARGYETLHYPDSEKGIELAEVCQKAMGTVMRGKDRGIKVGYYKMKEENGVDYFLRATHCPAVIIEPEFIQAFDQIEELRDDCCKAIAQGIFDHYYGG